MTLYDIVFLLPFFLASALTLTIPESSEIITFPTNSTILGSECHCEIGKRLTRLRPRQPDCANAILQLRNNNIDGVFHSGGIRNQWQLPETSAHGTCNVTVEMKPGRSDDEGSWLVINQAAGQLNAACVGTSMFSYLHGGYTYTGRTDGVRIRLMYEPPKGFKVELNGTVVSVEENNRVAGLVSVE